MFEEKLAWICICAFTQRLLLFERWKKFKVTGGDDQGDRDGDDALEVQDPAKGPPIRYEIMVGTLISKKGTMPHCHQIYVE